ncbi:hypothetical protein GFC01_05930 [Desulfofundulus thermobenzoicus]|uniref:Uncharacterized protein n=1 Tax=Desulfofundulus thermobenzoicus TaxID=29376 RepID=A0A6N7IRQ0_9FIRM|nr:hypothetical protein [Desulfofundulus thermobenzoicus]MQL51808.1 hypothetical protein [Desulfofundulus thermobenzoicus]
MSKVHKYQFYFRIEPEAGMAIDEDGNPIECYTKIGLDREKLFSNGEYEEVAGKLAEALAELLEIEKKFVISVTEEEYLANVEDGEDIDVACQALN